MIDMYWAWVLLFIMFLVWVQLFAADIQLWLMELQLKKRFWRKKFW